jgi:hypothetical protein
MFVPVDMVATTTAVAAIELTSLIALVKEAVTVDDEEHTLEKGADTSVLVPNAPIASMPIALNAGMNYLLMQNPCLAAR